MRLDRNVEVPLKRVCDYPIRSNMGRSLTTQGALTMGSTKTTPIWQGNSNFVSQTGHPYDRHDGVATEALKVEANVKRGTHNLIAKEWEERRIKGLCFCCNQPYTPTHKCPNPNLRVMLLGDDEELTEEGEVVLAEGEEEFRDEVGECSVLDSLGLSELYEVSEVKSQSLKTIKIEGTVNGIPLLIFVDSGATHNLSHLKL
ncbi:hypothetical protein SESBI_12611 [Sesbania bispinosa]|nr:hypothetical protein SESBI_12611 [Sesbania bispinosa]